MRFLRWLFSGPAIAVEIQFGLVYWCEVPVLPLLNVKFKIVHIKPWF
jgi:hypothetical protein